MLSAFAARGIEGHAVDMRVIDVGAEGVVVLRGTGTALAGDG